MLRIGLMGLMRPMGRSDSVRIPPAQGTRLCRPEAFTNRRRFIWPRLLPRLVNFRFAQLAPSRILKISPNSTAQPGVAQTDDPKKRRCCACTEKAGPGFQRRRHEAWGRSLAHRAIEATFAGCGWEGRDACPT